jgi:hypothetical protein
MAINPSTDIIADVIAAADPQRAASVEARLKAIAAVRPAESFESVVERARPTRRGEEITRAPARTAAGPSDEASRRRQALAEFEGAILGFLAKELLPKDQAAVAGGGQAGEMWRSMLADQVGRQIAKSGVLHIQERLFRTHPLAEIMQQGKVARAAQMSAEALSMGLRADGPSARAAGPSIRATRS